MILSGNRSLDELQAMNEDSYLQGQTQNAHFYNATFCKGITASTSDGTWMDFWLGGGDPAVGALGTAATATQFSDATLGAIQHGGNVSPSFKQAAWCGSFFTNTPSFSWTAIICDRVLVYDQCTVTGALANMTNVAIAQRYITGNNPGLQILATQQSALGGNTNLTDLKYVDAATGATHTAGGLPITVVAGNPVIDSAPPTCITNTVPFISLAGTDYGASSVVSYTTSAAQTGTLAFALVRPLLWLQLGFFDLVDMTRADVADDPILDGACLNLVAAPSFSAATGTFYGMLGFAWT